MTQCLFKNQDIHSIIKQNIISYCDFFQDKLILTDSTKSSVRTAGDSLEYIICNDFKNVIGPTFVDSFHVAETRKAMEDVKFEKDGNIYYVDIKTHNISTEFNMPNLTAIRNLKREYVNSNFYFVILMIKYYVNNKNNRIIIKDVLMELIEYFSWDCLNIGNLGHGQIQISNTNNIKIDKTIHRKDWLIEFCDRVISFNEKLAESILYERIEEFENFRRDLNSSEK